MSYVALDLEKMTVLFKAPDMRSACLISAMDFEEVTHCIFPVERNTATPQGKTREVTLPGFLTRMEQVVLYRNMTGIESGGGFNVGDLRLELHRLLLELPDDARSLFKLEQLAGLAELSADTRDIIRQPQPLIKLPSAPSIPVAPSIPSAPGIPSAPKIPSAPRIPSAPPTAPKAGSTTGKVWEIAESHAKDMMPEGTALTLTDLLSNKAFRNQVIAACEAIGINSGTAATQFGAWKRSKGL